MDELDKFEGGCTHVIPLTRGVVHCRSPPAGATKDIVGDCPAQVRPVSGKASSAGKMRSPVREGEGQVEFADRDFNPQHLPSFPHHFNYHRVHNHPPFRATSSKVPPKTLYLITKNSLCQGFAQKLNSV